MEFRFPDVGEGIHEGLLLKWLVNEGDSVSEHQPIVKVETDKAVVELPAPVDGKVKRFIAKEGETIKVGQAIVEIVSESTSIIGELPKTIVDLPSPIAFPAVRAKASDLGIDLKKVKGTGPEGVITMSDLKKPSPTLGFDVQGKVIRVPYKGIRKLVGERMLISLQNAPQVTHFDQVDATELAKVRDRMKIIAENKGYPLTYMPFIIKAAIIALKEHPYVNAGIDGEEIVLKKYYNLGFAVDTSNGLIVPVIKDADKKSILEIAKEMNTLANAAKSREIKPEELTGGTFTITNIGSIGGTFATPIINYPEAAILGLGRIQDQPVADNDQIVIRKILPVSLTFDHRVLDGAEAARFVNDLKKHLTDLSLMLVELE
jgi:pyruvate dehydrogenase E2 component (dihydrolipoamide acetyltransferase)